MSKVLEASCVAGVVTSQGLPVPGTVVLSEGVSQSEGILILDEDESFYVPKTTADLKTTIQTIVDILTQLTTALTAIDTKVLATTCPAGAGATAPLPLATANIVQLAVIQGQLTALKETLK